MLCFGAFGDVPDEDVAIVACRQHYPAIKGMGLQDKHFIRMALQLKIAHHRENQGNPQQQDSHNRAQSLCCPLWKIKPQVATKT